MEDWKGRFNKLVVGEGTKSGSIPPVTMGELFMNVQNIEAKKILLDFVEQELSKAREEGYQKGWEDGSKGKVFEKIEVETEVTFKDLRDVIEGREDAG